MEVLVLGCTKVNENKLNVWGMTTKGIKTFSINVPTRISVAVKDIDPEKIISLMDKVSCPSSVSFGPRRTTFMEIDQVVAEIPNASLAKKVRDTVRLAENTYTVYPFVQVDLREPEERVFLYIDMYPLSLIVLPEQDTLWAFDLKVSRNFNWPELPAYVHLVPDSIEQDLNSDPMMQFLSSCPRENNCTIDVLHSRWMKDVMSAEETSILKNLSVLSYDIETMTTPQGPQCRMISMVYSDLLDINVKKRYLLTFPRVTNITLPNCTVIISSDEEEMLVEFKRLLDLLDPTFTIGYNTISYDNVILRDRMMRYKIRPVESYDSRDQCYWMRKNSLHIDVLLLIRQLGISSDNSLGTISKLLLGHGKLSSQFDSMENVFKTIDNGNYKSGWKLRGIAKYCLMDSELVHELFTLYPLVHFVSKLSSVLHSFTQRLMVLPVHMLMESWYISELMIKGITYLPSTDCNSVFLGYKDTQRHAASLINGIRSKKFKVETEILDSVAEYLLPEEPNVLVPSAWNTGIMLSDRVSAFIIKSAFVSGIARCNSFTSFSRTVIQGI